VQERHEALVAKQVECASFSSDEDALVYNIDIEWLTDSILKQYIVLFVQYFM
jgi:hypothetical protein